MLAKLGWKVLLDPNNMWTRVVSTKYLNSGNILKAKKTIKASAMWRYILDYMYLIKTISVGFFGIGNRNNFWKIFRCRTHL